MKTYLCRKYSNEGEALWERRRPACILLHARRVRSQRRLACITSLVSF